MNRSSIFNLRIDFEKSQGSYLYDKNSASRFLDFFGQYSTLALGYNHKIFSEDEYVDEIMKVSHQKITNCEILSDETKEFDKCFRKFTSRGIFDYYHYCCTGALAVEAAIKTSMDYRGPGNHRLITFQGSFHGINGYGGIFTDRFEPVNQRLDGFPGNYWPPIQNPIIGYDNGEEKIDEDKVEKVLNDVENIILEDKKVCGILLEPVQCTLGDRYFPDSFFRGIRTLATKYDIPLIFDEIQVGFGSTGNIWYFESLPIEPDILIFGKKTQLSGIAVKEQFAKIFQKAIRLEVTWDADIIDMVRCKHVIRAYKNYDIIKNVNDKSSFLKKELSNISQIQNLRVKGLLVAFDFLDRNLRDKFSANLVSNGMICNPTGEKTVRLRPNLAITIEELEDSIRIIKKSI